MNEHRCVPVKHYSQRQVVGQNRPSSQSLPIPATEPFSGLVEGVSPAQRLFGWVISLQDPEDPHPLGYSQMLWPDFCVKHAEVESPSLIKLCLEWKVSSYKMPPTIITSSVTEHMSVEASIHRKPVKMQGRDS